MDCNMKLNELHKGDKAIIKQVDAKKALRDRFASFGIMRGEEITVKACSLARQTMEIEVGSTIIAMRADEAKNIEVEKIS